MSETEVVVEGSSLELITKAEADIAIETAKAYPRNLKASQEECMDLVTMDEKTANDCIYAIPRGGKTIEGPSARFAESLLYSWGNMVAGSRVIGEDGDFIVAQGMAHDLQKNVKIVYEVKRKIVDKYGKRFNADMIQVTANAGCSIALRNAALKVIPKAFWDPMYEAAKKTLIGDSKTLANTVAEALEYLAKFGATTEMVLKQLGLKSTEEITADHIVTLRGTATAIKDGDITVESAFGSGVEEKKGGAADVMEKVAGKEDIKKPAKVSAKKDKAKDGDDY
ncbi:hypothetical protein KAR91_44950 [Candidatus Pacearchaeota archaeon]|nr:hypothetical protein [Candidatus Pacearchaeota archaeon]